MAKKISTDALMRDKSLIPLSDFLKAYRQCRRHKRNTPSAQEFELDYESNLTKLWYEVNTKTYKIGKSNCFLVTRPKLREVFAADFRDRIIHHIIMMRLENLFEDVFIDSTYNCRKHKGTLYGVQDLAAQVKVASENYTKQCYIGKFDLKGFFMSIHKPTLWVLLRDFINEKYHKKDKEILLYLVKKVVFHHPEYNCERKTPAWRWKDLPKNKSLFTCGKDRGLAIGNLTSQCFANFYMHFFDDFMKSKFKYYGRYVDDFFIISDDKQKIVDAISGMAKFLKNKLKVKLHPDKIYIQPYRKGVKFTGSVVKGKKFYIGNQTVAGAYNKIRFYNSHIGENYTDKFIATLNSYFGFFKHYQTFHIKIKIVRLISPEWFKYITITGSFKTEKRNKINPKAIIRQELKTQDGIEKYYAFNSDEFLK